MLLSFLKDLTKGDRTEIAPAAAVAEPLSVPRLTYGRGGAIIAFVPQSEGDALRQHTLEMLKPLLPHCTKALVVDFRNPGWRAEFDAVTRDPVWFAMAPFGAGELFPADNDEVASPWVNPGIPFIRLFGDTPAYYPVKHLQHFSNSINAYGHAEHFDFYNRWFSPKAPTFWQPLFPFDAMPRRAVDVDRKAASRRIVFPKNGNCAERLVRFWRSSLPPAIAKALEAAGEEARSSLDEPFDMAASLQAHFARLAIDLAGSRRLLFFLVAQLDDYLRRTKSTLIARSLLDLPVVIRGVNWEHLDFSGRRATYDPDSDYTRTRDLLDSSLAIVDMSANTHRGAHDRALRAAGRFTTCLTNRTKFYVDGFPGAASFTYRFSQDSIVELVESALEHPAGTVELGLAQGERMRELLTEDYYVEQLVSAVDACAFGCGDRPADSQNFVDFRPLP